MTAEQDQRRRAEDGAGTKRDLEFPPAPEALPFSVYDNHPHFDIADGDTLVSVVEQLEKAALVGVVGVVQVGTDVASSASLRDHTEPSKSMLPGATALMRTPCAPKGRAMPRT